MFMRSCVFCVILFHEFYLRITTSSQAEFSYLTYFPQICTRLSQSLLRVLDVSHNHLDEICAMAQKYGLSGKYTNFGNGRCAYIWCPSYINETNITSFMDELNMRGFDVIPKLLCNGVKIENMTSPKKLCIYQHFIHNCI